MISIAIGSDHRGFEHKQAIVKQTFGRVKWIDVGTHNAQRSNFPGFTHEVIKAMRNGDAQAGILLCGTGVGMSIAANRFTGIYAALVWSEEVARLSKEHNNANILVLPSDFISLDEIVGMISSWLDAEFKGGRYQERIDMIDKIGGS